MGRWEYGGTIGRLRRSTVVAALSLGALPAHAQGVETGSGRLIGMLFLLGMGVLVLMLMPRFRIGRRQRRAERRRRREAAPRRAETTGARRSRTGAAGADAAAARRGMHVDEKH